MMEKHTVVLNAKLEFEIEANHEVTATSMALVWLCDLLTKEKDSPLVKVGFNHGEKEE